MTRKQSRLYAVLALVLGVSVAVTLVLVALKDNVSYFRTASDVVSGAYPERTTGRSFRLGGMVEKGSVRHEGEVLMFSVTDMTNRLTVRFRGVPPDLFREGQGVIADGKMASDGTFIAEQILAKHDEKYMPPNMAKMMPKTPAAQP